MNEKRILVLAYALSPTRGSEYSVAWNYVTEMSKTNKLVVLYGASGNHMGDFEEMEQFLSTSIVSNVNFIAIKPNRKANLYNTLNRKGILSYSFYLAYKVWHKQVYKKAIQLIKNEHFDLIHYLGPIGYREPGFLWKLDLPYMWGPIGGANNVPLNLIEALPFGGKFKLLSRSIINNLQLKYNKRLKKALNRCDILFTATTQNQNIFKELYHVDSIYLPENCIKGEIKYRIKETSTTNNIHIIWIGSLEARKSLIILLEALLLVKNRDRIIIDIIGDGPLRSKLQLFAENNGLSGSLRWYGNISRNEVFNLLTKADIHVITSLSEGNPTTIWEAMSVGVPIMTIDHCGMRDTICARCGIKIRLGPYRQVINEFAMEIDRIIEDPKILKRLSMGIYDCAKKYTWEERTILFNLMYDKAIYEWNQKKNI